MCYFPSNWGNHGQTCPIFSHSTSPTWISCFHINPVYYICYDTILRWLDLFYTNNIICSEIDMLVSYILLIPWIFKVTYDKLTFLCEKHKIFACLVAKCFEAIILRSISLKLLQTTPECKQVPLQTLHVPYGKFRVEQLAWWFNWPRYPLLILKVSWSTINSVMLKIL